MQAGQSRAGQPGRQAKVGRLRQVGRHCKARQGRARHSKTGRQASRIRQAGKSRHAWQGRCESRLIQEGKVGKAGRQAGM
jgi:hypothetical protein